MVAQFKKYSKNKQTVYFLEGQDHISGKGIEYTVNSMYIHILCSQ